MERGHIRRQLTVTLARSSLGRRQRFGQIDALEDHRRLSATYSRSVSSAAGTVQGLPPKRGVWHRSCVPGPRDPRRPTLGAISSSEGAEARHRRPRILMSKGMRAECEANLLELGLVSVGSAEEFAWGLSGGERHRWPSSGPCTSAQKDAVAGRAGRRRSRFGRPNRS